MTPPDPARPAAERSRGFRGVTDPTPSPRFIDLLEHAHASGDPADMSVLLDAAQDEGLTVTLPGFQRPGCRPVAPIVVTAAQIASWS